MTKQKNFKLSTEATNLMSSIQENTGESMTTIVEKGIYYYATHLNRTLLDATPEEMATKATNAPATLNVAGIDTYNGKQRKSWTTSDIKQLITMSNEGKSLSEISSYLGRSKASISKKLWEVK